MEGVSRAGACLLVLILMCLAGCGGAESPPPTPTKTPVKPTPALPADVLLQLYVPDTGELYRVATDGRFLVTPPGGQEAEKQPISKYDRGVQKVTPEGLERLRAALDEAGFFALPEQVKSGDCLPEGAVLPNSGRKVARQPVVFSAREDATEHTVAGSGDFAAPCTLAQLEPVYRALDLDALGDWRNE